MRVADLEQYCTSAAGRYVRKYMTRLMTAFVHLERGNPEGAPVKFRKARKQLSPLPAHYLSVDVAQIVERIDQALTVQEGVARGEPNLLALVPPFAIQLESPEGAWRRGGVAGIPGAAVKSGRELSAD